MQEGGLKKGSGPCMRVSLISTKAHYVDATEECRAEQLTHQVGAAACATAVNDLSIVINGSVADLDRQAVCIREPHCSWQDRP